MTRMVVSVDPSDSIERLADLMIKGNLHRLPVVDEGRLVGVITSMDR